MRPSWIVGLGLALAFSTSTASGQETMWRPVIAQTSATSAKLPSDCAVSLGRPIAVSLDRPIPVHGNAAIRQVSSAPMTDIAPSIVRAQAADVPPPGTAVVPPPPPDGPVIVGDPSAAGPPPAPGSTFWGKCKEFVIGDGPVLSTGGRSLFQSDHAFDWFISPVTNPFDFEDPRALTEVRPIFFFQSIPNKNPVFHGGSAEFFGLQARVAFTERWSVVMNKLGGVGIQPDSGSDTNGFAEIDIGPKYTFLRNERTSSLGAVGLTFQIPAGSTNVFQDTGNLSLMPYVTMGQSFWHTTYGSLNVLGNFGYSFATDNKRSEYFSTNLHLDYDVLCNHHFYPLVELNWRYYTRSGKERPFTFEGGDLINFGSTSVAGRNNLDLSVGARLKLSEAWQIGTAFSWPLVGTHDINEFRWTIDVILRY